MTFQDFTQRRSVSWLLKELTLNRDRGTIVSDWRQPRPAVMAQAWIDGTPANCAVACWQGKLLAGISVKVMASKRATGPASEVEVIDSPQMMRAAERVAARLRLSGFFGLDFMLERNTGAAYLIEMNPRCTPPCPLPMGPGRDLVAALCAQISGASQVEVRPALPTTRVRYFPQPWESGGDLDSRAAEDAYYDVPVDQPQLIEQLLHPWPERSLLGQWFDRMWKGRAQGRKSRDARSACAYAAFAEKPGRAGRVLHAFKALKTGSH
jgi:hypothetical protein